MNMKIAADDLALVPIVAGLAATFPETVRFAQDPAGADLVVIDGAGDWDVAVARHAGSGPRIAVVIDPRPLSAVRIEQVAETRARHDLRLVFSETFAGNPAVAAWSDAASEAQKLVRMDAAGEGSLDLLMLANIRMARKLGLGGIVASDVQSKPGAAVIAAQASRHGNPVGLRMTAVQTRAVPRRLVASLYGPSELCRISLPSGDTARPALAAIVNAGGEITLPTIYDTALRTTLRAELSGDQGSGEPGLAEFMADCALALRVADTSAGEQR